MPASCGGELTVARTQPRIGPWVPRGYLGAIRGPWQPFRGVISSTMPPMPDARETSLSGEIAHLIALGIPGPYGPFADGKEGVIGSSPMESFVGVPCVHGLSSAPWAPVALYDPSPAALLAHSGAVGRPSDVPSESAGGEEPAFGRQGDVRRNCAPADVREQPPPDPLRRSRVLRGPDRAADRRAPRRGSSPPRTSACLHRVPTTSGIPGRRCGSRRSGSRLRRSLSKSATRRRRCSTSTRA
jgi:hypothetical protein